MKKFKALFMGFAVVALFAMLLAPAADSAIDAVQKLKNDLAGALTRDANTGSYSVKSSGVTSASITDGAIVNDDVATAARIAFSKFANLSSAQLLVGSSASVPTKRAITGDVTIGNTGVTAIGSAKVTKTMLAAAVVPSHVIKYAGFATWSGVGKTKKVAIVGAVATDIMLATAKTAQISERLVSAYVLKNNTAIFTIYTGEVNNKSWQYTINRATE